MKCAQNSCQRNKKILSNGFCNVCNEAKAETEAKQKEKNKAIDVDVKHLMSLHENLESGKVVDQASINKMLIKGILKGIACHDTNRKEYDSKIEIMKTEHKTDKCRLNLLRLGSINRMR